MADNELWEKLLDPQSLKAGWNLTRNDAKTNFINSPYYTDVFAIAFEQNINEIVKQLRTNTYRPSPITFIDVPKSTFSIRPGSIPEIEDRIILQTIVLLLAPKADAELPLEAVYSYRIKKPPTADSIFKESDVLDIPYLKSKDINRYLDPFDPWYAAWPEFDEDSKSSFQRDGYRYLVVTDIAAYFENIQLPLLRDLLLKIFPSEQKIINLLMMFLEHWCPSTDQQRTFHRSIPQGTQISSFLGNLFLLPLDQCMETFCSDHEAKYFRYMDDVRLFTKNYSDARKALLQIDRTIRSLHLNTQSSKTEILEERDDNKEITNKLTDPRIDEIGRIIEEIKGTKLKLNKKEITNFETALRKIATRIPDSTSETKILGNRKPLKGLTLRAFRRWLTANTFLGTTGYIKYFVREIQRNPDHRLIRTFTSLIRKRPRLDAAGRSLFKFTKSNLNLLTYQHAEILGALRYFSKVPDALIEDCKILVTNENEYFYTRMNAALLLSRTVLEKSFLDKCREAFKSTDDANVRIALTAILMQSTGKIAASTLHMLVFHPNNKIRKMGKLLREVRYDKAEAARRLKFLFSSEHDWILCDNMGLLFSMSLSPHSETLKLLIKCATKASLASPRLDMRVTLAEIASRATIQLHNIQPRMPIIKVTQQKGSLDKMLKTQKLK